MMEIFAPLSPGMLKDPYPVYDTLRTDDPVHWHDQLNAWVVTRYPDCVRILLNPKTFVSDFRVIGEKAPDEFLSLQTVDPPEHTELRHLLLPALRGVDLASWEAGVAAGADELLSRLDQGEFDFIADFAEPLAISAMCSLFGIPFVGDEARFRAAQRDLVLSMDTGLAPERHRLGMDARTYLSGLIEPWVQNQPETGLLSRIDVKAAGDLLLYLINSLRAIFVAGYSSVSSTLGNIVRALAERDLLDGDRPAGFTLTAFNELIRFAGAVQAISRAVTEDIELGGRVIARGDVVVAVVAGANRDPDVFGQPGELVLDREPNPHLGFGRGVHSCLGTNLAVRIGMAILGVVDTKYRLQLVDVPVQRPAGTMRGLDRMMVKIQPR